MKFCYLGSGSKGNCLAVWHEGCGLFIDTGLSWKQMALRLEARAIDPACFQAVFLSHYHGDHVKGLEGLTKNLGGLPVYATYPTAEAFEFLRLHDKLHRPIGMRDTVAVGPFSIQSFPTQHTATGAITFTVERAPERRKLALLFETGAITRELQQAAAGAHALLIEANHEPKMLAYGEYPDFLIERVAASHLSNASAAEQLKVLDPATSLVMLVHLSEQNNFPNLAVACAREALNGRDDVALVVAGQKEPTEVFEI